MIKSIDWYSPTNIKSYNKFLNFIIGGRGIGKTYGFKKTVLVDIRKRKTISLSTSIQNRPQENQNIS